MAAHAILLIVTRNIGLELSDTRQMAITFLFNIEGRGNFKKSGKVKDTKTYNQKEILDVSGTHNVKGGFGEK